MLTWVSLVLCRATEGGRVELGGGRCTTAHFVENSSVTRPNGAATVVSIQETNHLYVAPVARPSPGRTDYTHT